VLLKKIPNGLPPLRRIEHHIDLFLELLYPTNQLIGAIHKRLKKFKGKLMSKGWVQESMSLCVVPVILVSKKDGT